MLVEKILVGITIFAVSGLTKYALRLNPNKCTFEVRSGKLLGFVVSGKGIEVNPAKVKAIQEIPAPCTEKEVKGLLGRLNYIARFISHLTSTCAPIFKLLKKDQVVRWNDDFQIDFDKIKEYLQEPPILMPPVEGRPLIIYLIVLKNSMRGGCWAHMTSLAEKCMQYTTLAKSLRTVKPDIHCSRKLVALWHGLPTD